MFTKVTEQLDKMMTMGTPGYDCAIYHKGKCVYRHMNGYADEKNKIPMSGNERYNIYSCSKPITCTAALQLYEKGLFKLEDKLSDYIPEFSEMYVKTDTGVKKAEKPITIKDLFCMTAGFSYELNSPMIEKCKKDTNGKCPTVELVRYLAKEPLLFEPGENWEYSLAHDVLAALVEVISGVPFAEYVKKNIFDPLGMNNSTFLLDDSELDTISCQYRHYEEEGVTRECEKTIVYKLGSEYASGGAGCISTVDDYMKFLEALRIGDIILKKETIDLMTTDWLDAKQKESFWITGYSYGLGVRCPTEGSDVTDFGWGGAAGAYLGVDRENEYTIYYAQHVLSPATQEEKRKLAGIVREILR